MERMATKKELRQLELLSKAIRQFLEIKHDEYDHVDMVEFQRFLEYYKPNEVKRAS